MVTLKASYTVKPAGKTPMQVMSLTNFDQVAAITHASVVFFYQNFGDEFESTVETLRDALSKILVTFYPLAGRLRMIDGGRFELDCNAFGARLLIAESEAKLVDFGDFNPTPEIQALTPQINYQAPIHELPLLLVQLTKMGCGGICVGFAVSHIVVDGPAAFHFFTEWARLARGNEQPTNPPYLDRAILQDHDSSSPPPSGVDYEGYSPPPLLIGHSDSSSEREEKTVTAMLKLNKQQVDKLKCEANEGRTSGRPYSGYESIAGHMWRCASRARGHPSDQLTRLSFPMDAKNRLEPPVPQYYFGNTMCRIATSSTSGELISNPLCYASSKIREAINMATGTYLRSSLRYLKCLKDLSQYRNSQNIGTIQGAFHGNPNMVINSWTRLPIYSVDFGWGKPVHMGPAALGSDGKSVILPGREADGSVIVMVQLQIPHMEAFKKIFYQDI